MKGLFFKKDQTHFETVLRGITVRINKKEKNRRTVAYAENIVELYLNRKKEIIDYILENQVAEFYKGRYTADEIRAKLYDPEIEILSDDWGTMVWINHELDEHIIQVEFDGDMELSYVTIDG